MHGSGGILYVVATPIGNLGDLGARAETVLREADVVLAEDTRVTRRLLDAHGIAARLESFHEHNERRVAEGVLRRLAEGARVALVSDAGTPLLSDPGFELVREAHARGIAVRAVPGPSAVTAALSVSGLPTHRFWFEGFLPPRREARRQRLAALRAMEGTLVFFEAPHRVRECVDDLCDILGGERDAAFARELTKRHEEVCRDRLDALRVRLAEHAPRGEFVLLVAGAGREDVPQQELDRVLACALEVLPTREAASLAARITGTKRNRAYARAIELKGE